MVYWNDLGIDGIIELTDKEFSLISELVYKKFGINLTDKKKALVRGRLNKLIKTLGFTSFEDYYNSIINDPTGSQLSSMIDRISTNHSFFFREKDHFDFLLTKALPELVERFQSQAPFDLKIWCAGCAAGEEAYTLAMILAEYFGLNFFKGRPPILATDISLTTLNQAVKGEYPKERISTVPEPFRKKYIRESGAGVYKVIDELKRLVLFKRLNFMN
ncbi:MAG: protein-glutamate O-methyltransferase CheR, partial [Spirochaetota bacterium]